MQVRDERRALATYVHCTYHHRPLLGRPDSSQSACPRTSMSSCLSGRPVRNQIQPYSRPSPVHNTASHPFAPHPTPHPGQSPPHPHANDAEANCLLYGVLPHLPVYLVLRSTVVPDSAAQLQVHHTRLAKFGGNVFQTHVCC